jgi:intraflagellar transport protein 122
VAVGSNDGTITLHQLVFGTVHGLYQDRYAFRENMTDVVLQNLTNERRVRIKCGDLVKKIAIFKDRLAVQLPARIVVYDLFADDDTGDLTCRVRERIERKVDCNLLVVTARHIILCLERRLQLLTFSGTRVREWSMDSTIRYIKVIGGPPEREALLVGLKSGLVMKIFIDNAFPVALIRHKAAIRCLDLNSTYGAPPVLPCALTPGSGGRCWRWWTRARTWWCTTCAQRRWS